MTNQLSVINTANCLERKKKGEWQGRRRFFLYDLIGLGCGVSFFDQLEGVERKNQTVLNNLRHMYWAVGDHTRQAWDQKGGNFLITKQRPWKGSMDYNQDAHPDHFVCRVATVREKLYQQIRRVTEDLKETTAINYNLRLAWVTSLWDNCSWLHVFS